MNFSGKYQVQTQENYEAFMKAVGECWAEAGIMAMKAWPCEWWPVRVLKSDRRSSSSFIQIWNHVLQVSCAILGYSSLDKTIP